MLKLANKAEAGATAMYAKGIKNANLERIARLVKIVGMLLHTKVYLFWNGN